MNTINRLRDIFLPNQTSSVEPVQTPERDPRPVPDESDLLPVCDGYSLADAAAVEATKTINDEWWDELGSAKLAAALEVSDIDKRELADLVDLHHKTVGNHLRGTRSPSPEGIEAYENVFGDGFFHEPQYDIKFTGVTDDV